MNTNKKKNEAVARMKKMDIFDPAIEQFKTKGTVNISETSLGLLHWAEEEDLKRIRQFETEYNALVYMVIRTDTTFGTLDSMLFVSNDPQEWRMDRKDLTNGRQLAYVYNHDAPEFSEIGDIGLSTTRGGGLRRTW